MFEEYLKDSHFLANIPEKENATPNERMCYVRSSIFHAASALEAYVNYIGAAAEYNNIFSATETDFLNDRIVGINPNKGCEEVGVKFNSIDDKLTFLIKKLSNSNTTLKSDIRWKDYLRLKQIRNDLVHPRTDAENYTLLELSDVAKSGFAGAVYVINELSIMIFGKALRQSLLELSQN